VTTAALTLPPKRDRWPGPLDSNPSTHRYAALRVTACLKSFVNTFRRDYLSRMDLSDAPTVMRQLPAAFEHFNEMHPHSSLKMKSPRQFRQWQAKQCQNQPAPSASTCVQTVSGYTGARPFCLETSRSLTTHKGLHSVLSSYTRNNQRPNFRSSSHKNP